MLFILNYRTPRKIMHAFHARYLKTFFTITFPYRSASNVLIYCTIMHLIHSSLYSKSWRPFFLFPNRENWCYLQVWGKKFFLPTTKLPPKRFHGNVLGLAFSLCQTGTEFIDVLSHYWWSGGNTKGLVASSQYRLEL